MARNRNTDVNGKSFASTAVLAVWQEGKPIEGYDADTWRHDRCGQVMKYQDYGNTTSKHGWSQSARSPSCDREVAADVYGRVPTLIG